MKFQIEGTELISCDPMGAKEVVVPEGIKSIESYAFEDCSSLEKIILPDGLAEIGRRAFANCSGLRSIVIPPSVTLIRERAFCGCTNLTSVSISSGTRIESYLCFKGTPWYETLGEWKVVNGILLKYMRDEQHVTIPDTVTEIAAGAFRDCLNLQTIDLPDGLVRIGEAAFESCESLLSIHIPDSVTEIGQSAFNCCRKLREIYISKNVRCLDAEMFCMNPWFLEAPAPFSVNGVLLKHKTSEENVELPEGICAFDPSLFRFNKTIKRIVIPEGVTLIPSKAFYACDNLSEIILPQSLERIDDDAFRSCRTLREIVIPDRVTSIGRDAFNSCDRLAAVTFPSNLISIGSGAFFSCALKSVSLPESLVSIGSGAFLMCYKLENISIPSGAQEIGHNAFYKTPFLSNIRETFVVGTHLIKYVGNEETYTVPDHITHIYNEAFSKSTLKKIVLPDSVKCIESSAFANCSELISVTMPSQLEDSFNVFYGCAKLQNMVIPEGVSVISSGTFAKCAELSSVIFPDSIKRIDEGAFLGCVKLEYIELPSVDVEIDKKAFSDCSKLKTKFRKYVDLKTKEKLATDGLSLNPAADDEERAWVLTYQGAKGWNEWVSRTAESFENILRYCTQLVQNEKKPSATMVKRISAFMLDHKAKLKAESILSILDLFEEKKCAVDRKQFGALKTKSAGNSRKKEDPYAAFVAECMDGYVFAEEAVKAVKAGTKIAYQSKRTTASLDEIRFVVSEYVALWHQCKSRVTGGMGREVEILPMSSVMNVKISSKAEQIVDKLKRTALDQFLRTLAEGARYRPFLLAYARFATPGETAHIISEIHYKRRGTAQEKYWASNMEAALLINDTREAMRFFEDNRKLDVYAQWRGMTAQELRDSSMLPEFGFDEDGVKRYDIGGNIIEVTIAQDLSCQLFDTAKQKVIKTMPRKSDDPEKASACANAFAEFKKAIQQFYKQRMALAHELHTEGTQLENASWRKVYLGHPVLKYLTRLLVWQDETGKSFMPVDGKMIDSREAPYDPQGKITLAHVLTLSEEEIAAWQGYLSAHHLAQPFAQLWEPVVRWNDKQLGERYENATIGKAERNAAKNALAAWGITMRSETQEGYYDYRANEYRFSNEGTLNFENCYYLEYTVDADTGDTTFASAGMWRSGIGTERTARIMNAVLLQLDLAVATTCVVRDQAEKLAQVKLDSLTVVQLNDLISAAVENNASQCAAYLLDLKNKRFPSFDQTDDLVLDW